MNDDNIKYKTIKELYEDIEFLRALNDANNAMEPVVRAIIEAMRADPTLGEALLKTQKIATEYIDEHFPEMKGKYRIQEFVFPIPWPPTLDR